MTTANISSKTSDDLLSEDLADAIALLDHTTNAEILIRENITHFSPESCSLILNKCSKRGEISVSPDIIQLLMDHGADPTYIPEGESKSAIENFSFYNGVFKYSDYGGHRKIALGDGNWQDFFIVATHPCYPLDKRNELHRIILEKHPMAEPLAIGNTMVKFDDIGTEGAPDPFACMMHVLSAANRCNGQPLFDTDLHGRPIKEEDSHLHLFDRSIEMLKNHRGDWVEQSRRLIKMSPQSLYDVQDMVNTFCEQVIMPNVRHHLPPEKLATLDCYELREQLINRMYHDFIKDKTLFDMLELSEKWHKHAETLDANIRTIPRVGQWHPLLKKNEILHVPDDVAKGWTIRNVTDAKDLNDVGDKLHMCIATKTELFLEGQNHVFVFYSPEGHPISTWRVALDKSEERNVVREGPQDAFAKSIHRTLHCMDRTDFGNNHNFSPECDAAFEWLRSSLKDGSIELQSNRIGETDESRKARVDSPVSDIERIVGFPLSSPEAAVRHQAAFELWANSADALLHNNRPAPDTHLPFNRATAVGSGAYKKGPDIGTRHGKFLVRDTLDVPSERLPESVSKRIKARKRDLSARDASVDSWYYGNGYDKIMREVLSPDHPELLPEQKFFLPDRIKIKQDQPNRSRA